VAIAAVGASALPAVAVEQPADAAWPAVAAAPHRGGTYGGGFLGSAGVNVVSAKVAGDGKTLDLQMRVALRCSGRLLASPATEFGGVKIGRDGRFSAKLGAVAIKGTIDGGRAGGTLSLSDQGCDAVEKRWQARDVRAPRRARRGGARKGGRYYGTNATVQDLFDSKGARGPFMLRVSKDGRAVVQAFMRAKWACKEGAAPPERFFDNQDVAGSFRISKRGRFGKTFTAEAAEDDGTVTIFKTSFEGRFAHGSVTGVWRERTEHKPSKESATVLGSCDSGNVAFEALP
jgi:hypothetical protein